jgi:hypothetical protein
MTRQMPKKDRQISSLFSKKKYKKGADKSPLRE